MPEWKTVAGWHSYVLITHPSPLSSFELPKQSAEDHRTGVVPSDLIDAQHARVRPHQTSERSRRHGAPLL